MEKRCIIILDMKPELEQELPQVTGFHMEEMIIMRSFGAIIQPFGCLLRNIIMSIYDHPITDIYLVGERHQKGQPLVNHESILDKMRRDGISEEAIRTIEYVPHTVGSDLLKWLSGEGAVDLNISKGIKMIQNHPLIPRRIQVHGRTVDLRTKESEGVPQC
ncbi:hypothetical protein [Ammoniphilus sp. YIM 78166]|uniref:hypothetical protein n=1 Tax=Ammoniphilus sp. YIM 78166 TaxID=1644106 RepID=UPI00106F8615|nr:hypothetical protein [Ammoniphilus sp. YIM 78166]